MADDSQLTDEELALRLQAEELGLRPDEVHAAIDPTQFSYTAFNPCDHRDSDSDASLAGYLDHANDNARPFPPQQPQRQSSSLSGAQQVRRNAIDSTLQRPRRRSKLVSSLLFLMMIAEIIISSVLLSLYWHQSCGQPINVWVLVYTARYCLWWPYECWISSQRRRYGDDYELSLTTLRISSVIKYCVLVWFIVGLYFTISEACTHDPLYQWTIVLLCLYGLRLVYPLIFFALVCLCLPCALLLLKYLEPRPVDQSVIDAMPVRKYDGRKTLSPSGNDECNDEPTCTICMEEYQQGQELRVLPHCRPRPHLFHKECVDNWLLTQQPTCPLCRTAITEEGREDQAREREREADEDRRRRELEAHQEPMEAVDNANSPWRQPV